MPRLKVRRRYPAKEVVATGEQFFQFLSSTGRQDVTDKEELRSLYYEEFKTCLENKQVCGFSTLINFLRFGRKIRIRDGHIYQQRVYDSVTIDQYTTIRKAERELQGDSGDQGRLNQRKKYPCMCNVCGVLVNSEVVYREHIKGNRHRVNMLRKDINSKRSDLIQDKSGIIITSQFDDDNGNVTTQVRSGQDKDIDFVLKLQGNKQMALISIALLRPRPEFSVSDEHKVFTGVNIVKMPPGTEYAVKLTCSRTSNIGRLASPVVFAFRTDDTREIFQILRFVSIMVVSDVIEDLPASKPYTPPPKFAAREKKREIVEGERPKSMHKNPLGGIGLPFYDIPKDLNHAVNNKHKLVLLRQQLKPPLKADNHCEKFHQLLYIEELQMQVDIRRYDKQNQSLVKDKSSPNLFRLHVPGLAENRPSVLKGDHLFCRFSDKSDNKSYKGYVHRVEQEDVVLGFHPSFLAKFVSGLKFDIEFTFSRFPLLSQHYAVETAMAESGLYLALFPEPDVIASRAELCKISSDLQSYKRKLFDQKLSSNMEQVQAVQQIVLGASRPAPYLVFGPPGTGKTVTMVEAAKQVYHTMPLSRILVSAPSNSAADLVATRLISHGTPIAKTHLFRFYAASRPAMSIDPLLKEKKCCNLVGGDLYIPTKEELQTKRIIVTTLVTAGRLARALFPKDFFSHVFIDEAGHATEPEALIALAGLLNLNNPLGGQVVLAGDPKQLGPVLRSPLSIEYGLALSLLERLMTKSPVYARRDDGTGVAPYDKRILTKLLQNYRSHPDILKLPNELFYDNELQVFANQLVRESFCNWEELPKQNFPIIFHGVEGKDEREEQSPSFFNNSEIEIVVDYVRKVMQKRGGQKMKEDDIGVISPYRKQVQKLRQVLKKRRFGNIKVGSVEEFQGQERLIIIISTVRSTKEEYLQMDSDFKLGFLKNPKRFNVAISRAKALLIVVGNPFMLSRDDNWNRLLDFCLSNGAYRGCAFSREERDVDDIIEQLQKVHLGTLPPEEEPEEGLQISHVTRQNDPEWRSEN